ncbi:uncharacterized protein A1O9_05043 [Exophiala aquamarina CBS 119918]|uniref:Septin-type G domain-containing protein n=1 Tax=Exophiala aquamarina CBS 119918 TaxID=1182545 RepID=A0A072PLI0_9EURO|nr:uncharacterized protein A1O9_05043 [Exophiala aquamarina CBS 119918]KEF60193.1 hypothetical protein A1O9_05043 [Exophiala aquamarina CBS 119918]
MLAEEARIKRNARFKDNKVHVLLYFITPTGHGLRELDIELMKRLSPCVNLVLVTGKAEAHTPEELQESKSLIIADIEHYNIPVYKFPENLEEDDRDTIQENTELRNLLPFAFVGLEALGAGEPAPRTGSARAESSCWYNDIMISHTSITAYTISVDVLGTKAHRMEKEVLSTLYCTIEVA